MSFPDVSAYPHLPETLTGKRFGAEPVDVNTDADDVGVASGDLLQPHRMSERTKYSRSRISLSLFRLLPARREIYFVSVDCVENHKAVEVREFRRYIPSNRIPVLLSVILGGICFQRWERTDT